MALNLDSTEKRILLTVIFCMSLTISNLITIKIIDLPLWEFETPAGVLIYPLVYILTNVITEVYGESAARRTLILGLGANTLFVFMTTLIIFLPSPGYYTGDASLSFVFSQTPRILVASYISFLCGNLVNVRLTTIANRSKTHLSIRNYFAIMIGELVDNILFIGLAYLGSVAMIDVVMMIFTHWVITMIWIAIAQPFTNRTVRWAKKGSDQEVATT